jgi:predicted neutral ceramidase superfamily lipid hydrolase
VILLIAGRKFNFQASNVENVLVGAAQNATDNLHNVSATLGSVKLIVQSYNQDLFATLNSTEASLDSLAGVVSDKVFVNKKTYQKVFKIV